MCQAKRTNFPFQVVIFGFMSPQAYRILQSTPTLKLTASSPPKKGARASKEEAKFITWSNSGYEVRWLVVNSCEIGGSPISTSTPVSQDQPSTTGTGCFKFHLIDLPLDRNHGLFIHFLSICHGCYTLRADAPPSPWGQTLHYQGILKKKIPNLNCSVAMDTLLDEWKWLNNTVDFNHKLDDYLRNMDEVPTENENHHEPPSTLLGVHPKCPLKKANYFPWRSSTYHPLQTCPLSSV